MARAAQTKSSQESTAKTATDQSTIASKTAPAIVSASSPQVKSALKASDAAKASAMAGEVASVQATIADTYSPTSHSIVILDLAKDYHDSISAVAFAANFSKLPDLQKLTGQHVLLTGKIEMYKGKPELVLSSGDQIHIIK